MARINIEESIHKDERFFELATLLGGKQNALGALVWAWIVAQPYWLMNQSGIPVPAWKQQKIRDEILSVGLARQEGDFIYVCGSKDQFSWLVSAQAKGIRSGEVRRAKSLNNFLNPVQLGSTSSSSSSSSSKRKKNTYMQEGIKSCIQEYQATLDKYAIPRKAQSSEVRIASLGQRFGFEDLKLAIIGMRCEKRTDKFNPADWISLERLTAKNFERFMNLGAKHGKREQDAAMGDGQRINRQDNSRIDEPSAGDSDQAISDVLRILRRNAAS